MFEVTGLKATELSENTENDDAMNDDDSFEESLSNLPGFSNKVVSSTSDLESIKVAASTSVNSEAVNELNLPVMSTQWGRGIRIRISLLGLALSSEAPGQLVPHHHPGHITKFGLAIDIPTLHMLSISHKHNLSLLWCCSYCWRLG